MNSNQRISYGIQTLRRVLTAARTMDIEQTAFELYERTIATSASISHLENWLGHRLFIREGNKIIALTAAGKVYLEYAQTILDAQEKFEARMSRLRSGIPEEAFRIKLAGVTCFKCPNCGAPVSIIADKCEYCASNLYLY